MLLNSLSSNARANPRTILTRFLVLSITILIFVNHTTYANDKLFTFDKNTTHEEIKAFANHACNTVLIETVKMRIDEHSKAEIDNIIKYVFLF